MQNFQIKLLAVFSISCLVLQGCSFSRYFQHESSTNTQYLVIDMENQVEITNMWSDSAVDCSTVSELCVAIGSRFVLAIPRNCNQIESGLFSVGNYYRFRVVGLDEHRPIPTASYVSREFPNWLLFYSESSGFVVARNIVYPVDDYNFSPDIYTENYTIRFLNPADSFVCE